MGGFRNQAILKKNFTKLIAILRMQPSHSRPFKTVLGGLGGLGNDLRL